MFEELQNNQANKVDDIFAESDQSNNNQASASMGQAPQGIPQKSPSVNPQSMGASFDDFEESGHGSGRVLKTIFAIILILALIGVSAYFVYSKILLPRTINNIVVEDQNNLNQNQTDSNNFQFEEDLGQPLEEENNTSTDDLVINDEESEENVLKNIDTDGDGLSDFDEVNIYKTDPLNPDTDGDGLSDFDEAMIFGTDPLNPDTDGDGYLDGQEVLSGYNPLGDGKINMTLIKNMDLLLERYPDLATK